jgi:hypothetical protein
VQPNLKSSAGFSTAFVSKNARGRSSPELNSLNERLWNGCLCGEFKWSLRLAVGPNSRTLVGPSSNFPMMDWREFRFFNVLEDGVCVTCAPGDQEDLISGNCG